LQNEKPHYDVILCLSVTKWIHLNYGDDGVKFMFSRIFKQLKQGGVLILEAQPYSNYKRRCKITPEIHQNYKSIQLKPEHFEKYLLDEIGYAECYSIGDKEIFKDSNLPKNFQRPLKVFVKR
jgi:7SK snRNA methylphosphate capping enzyme